MAILPTKAARADAGFAAFALVASLFFLVEAQRLPPARFDPLGPGAFPIGISILIALLSAVALVMAVAGRDLGRAQTSLIVGLDDADATHTARPWLGVATMAALVVFVGVLQWTELSFAWASAGFITVLGVLLSDRSPKSLLIAVCVGLAMGFGLAYLFGRMLLLLLP